MGTRPAARLCRPIPPDLRATRDEAFRHRRNSPYPPFHSLPLPLARCCPLSVSHSRPRLPMSEVPTPLSGPSLNRRTRTPLASKHECALHCYRAVHGAGIKARAALASALCTLSGLICRKRCCAASLLLPRAAARPSAVAAPSPDATTASPVAMCGRCCSCACVCSCSCLCLCVLRLLCLLRAPLDCPNPGHLRNASRPS